MYKAEVAWVSFTNPLNSIVMLFLLINNKLVRFSTFTEIHNTIRDNKKLSTIQKNDLIDQALDLLKSMPYDFDIMDYHKKALTSLKTQLALVN